MREKAETALGHLANARRAFREVGDQRGLAVASLTLARMLVSLGRVEEGVQAAQEAREVDPGWEDVVVFLSQRALAEGEMDQAKSLLVPYQENEPRSPEIDRQRDLIASI